MKKLFVVFITLVLTGIGFGQTYFDVTKDFPCNNCGNNYNPNAKVDSIAVYEMPKIKSVFKKIANESGIEFNYPQGGCQQRAQIMSMLLSKEHKIEHFRVWLFAPINLDKNSSVKLEIKDKNNFDVSGKIEWNYHVAPVVRITTNNKVENFVIDPSLNSSEPMLLTEWFKAIGNSSSSKYTFLNSDKYFFNTQLNSSVISGFFYNFEGYGRDNLTLEKGLSLNDVAMSVFKKHITPFNNSSDAAVLTKTKALKTVFGNATTIEKVISENSSGNNGAFEYTTHRYLFTNYPEIIMEARKLYQERISFWTSKTNKLF